MYIDIFICLFEFSSLIMRVSGMTEALVVLTILLLLMLLLPLRLLAAVTTTH